MVFVGIDSTSGNLYSASVSSGTKGEKGSSKVLNGDPQELKGSGQESKGEIQDKQDLQGC